ncbi:TetR/AcrR family transcriptional regulator [Streptomyces sp. DSM 41527]|uniref:TetR/AcrR family transcriptional regulator n=1 Tax=Streptomyces mooreae TaxID=3075523 RepID=A0ABU2T5B3_9ACTN|nr:TetR/AcrR family transcriptional regulator [Streptomyces sp. DSM 41527]MDT0456407.1 TetR/AcrR family transcriptional regulator [Streptomyces sp. DSM 41527]
MSEERNGTRRGGPRKAQEIFDATLDLLAEKGYEGLTIEGVAQRSGVNKTTLYRWWPSKGALLGAALIGARQLELTPPDTGSLEEDLEALLGTMTTLLTERPASDIAVAVLGAVTHSPELASHVKDFFADRIAREQVVFDRAVARGEIAADADPLLLMDLLAGAAWVRIVLRQLPLEKGFVARTVRTVLKGARDVG